MSKIPANGERIARIGYEAQDKRAANLIYDFLIEGSLEWFRITDTQAGRVDDIQIATSNGELHAFQVKWSETTRTITFAEFTRSNKNPSLIAQLADGWKRLKVLYPDLRIFVHLINSHIPYHKSPLDDPKIKLPIDDPPPLQPNFQGFIRDCWKNKNDWIHLRLSNIPQGWNAAMDAIQREIGIYGDAFIDFVEATFLHFGYQFPEHDQPASPRFILRERDVDQIARLIAKLGGGERRIIHIPRADLLNRLNWASRFEFHFKHDFPIDEQLYQPIVKSVEEIETSLEIFKSGYIALVGTPGSGKSTTLTHTLRYRKGLRIIRYYSYVPNSPWQEGRGEAISFLHDLHLALQRQGIFVQSEILTQPNSLADLREALSLQFSKLHERWLKDKILTLIIVDGLDHIEREQLPERSLLRELPLPESIPEGLLFVLGSQTLFLNDIHDRIQHHLDQQGRTIILQALSKEAVLDIISASSLPFSLSYADQETIYRLSNGHPLALRYLLSAISNNYEEKSIKDILNSSEPYKGHIEENYQIYWDRLKANEELKELFALICRLRGPFNPESLLTWASEKTALLLLTQAKHYFWTESTSRWHFFHNSFRQFILKQTQFNILGNRDVDRDKSYHSRLADFASSAQPNTFWSWEELYHRACSEQWEKVIEIGTQAYFRNQFMNMRHIGAIYQDTALCLKAAQIKQDGLAIIRTILVEKELGDRQDNFNTNDLSLASLLYEVRGMDASINYVMDGQQIIIDDKEALKFVGYLIEKGKLRVAEKVFNASEPIDILNGSTPVENIQGGNIETIYAWAEVVHHFRSLSKIFYTIDQLRLENSHIRRGHKPEYWHRNVRYKVFTVIVDSIFESEDTTKINMLKILLKEREDGDLLLRRLDFNYCTFRRNKQSSVLALNRLIQWAEEQKPESHTRLQIAEFIFRIQNNKRSTYEWIKKISQPPLTELIISSSNDKLKPFLFRIRLNRLFAALGHKVEPTIAVQNDAPRNYGAVLFERNLVAISNIWGIAWAGKKLPSDILLRQLHSALHLFCRPWQETNKWTTWYSYRDIAPDFYEFLIHAVAQHGFEALQELAKQFDRCWEAQPYYWWPKLRRAISLSLYRRGCPLDDLIDRLRTIENLSYEREDASTLISEIFEQTFAWIEAKQTEKAIELFPNIFSSSFGIVYDKDYQFTAWVEWLGRATSALPDSTINDIHRFAAALVVIERSGRGRGTQNAAANFIKLVANFDPSFALNLKDWLLSNHAIHYTRAIEGLLRAATSSSECSLTIVIILTCHLLIPFVNFVPKELIIHITKKCALKYNSSDLQEYLNILNRSIETKVYPSQRAQWWRSMIKGLQSVGVDASDYFGKIAEDKREKRYETDLNVHLKTGEKMSESDALLLINSGAELLQFMSQIKEAEYFKWEDAIDKIIDKISREEVYKILPKIAKKDHSNSITASLAKRLKKIGYEKEGWSLLQSLVDQSVPQGWNKYWDGGSRLSALNALIDFDAEQGRLLAYEMFVNDYLSTIRYPSSIIEHLDDYLPLFFEKAPISDIWNEIRDHIYHLQEFICTESLPILSKESSLHFESALIKLILDAMTIEIAEIKEEAHRAFCEILKITAYDAQAKEAINSLLDGEEYKQFHGLAILESALEWRPEFIGNFTYKLHNLSISANMTIRTMARGIIDALGAPIPIPDLKDLPIVYRMELPDFRVYDEVIPFSSLPTGASFPDSDDSLEMVRPFQDDFKLLSDLSTIPIQNLIMRAAELMKSLSPIEKWNKEAEEGVKAWLKAANLKLTYHRLRPKQALRAINHVIAELSDSKKMNNQALDMVKYLFIQHDWILSGVIPNLRPKEIVLNKSNNRDFYRDSTWIEKGTDSFSLMPEQLSDGRIVIAELTRIRHLGWEIPTEYRLSMLCHPDFLMSSEIVDAYYYFPFKYYWTGDSYPELGHSKNPAIAVYGNPRTCEIGYQEWIAFNPALARHLDWTHNNNGLFRWEDTNGVTAVESLFWKDGPINRLPPQDDECSEGWVILTTEKFYKKIIKEFNPILRNKTIVRSINKRDDDERETFVKVFTQDFPPI